MTKRRAMIFALLAVLYIHTWVGGWISHSRAIELEAQRRYIEADCRNTEAIETFEGMGGEEPYLCRLRPGGPRSGVSGAIPLLPGVLLVDSYYIVGPLCGRGGRKIVLYYGAGSYTLCNLGGWIS